MLLCFASSLTLEHTLQSGKTWYKITLLSLTEVCFLSPQYKSRGAKVKVKTPAQTDPSPQCQTSDDSPAHRRYGVSDECSTTPCQLGVGWGWLMSLLFWCLLYEALLPISNFIQGSRLHSVLTPYLVSIRIIVIYCVYWILGVGLVSFTAPEGGGATNSKRIGGFERVWLFVS